MADQPTTQVRAEKTASGITIHLEGRHLAAVDVKQLQDCAASVMRCADANACFSGGFSLTEACVQTISKHDASSKCVSEGFGLGRVATA